MTTAKPTRYEPGDSGDRDSSGRGGGVAGLIAASIVTAGFLLGLGIFLAILLRSPSGTGTASDTPSPSAGGSGAPVASLSPGASAEPSADGSAAATASMPADPLPEYVARLPIAFHACAGTEEPSEGDVAVVEFLDELYGSAVSNRRCIVDRLVVSLHGFESGEAMNAAYGIAGGAHLSHTESCEVQIRAGQGGYSFADGREGQAVCLQHSGGHWIMWTDEVAGVLAVTYGTNTSSEASEILLAFWRERFSLGPAP